MYRIFNWLFTDLSKGKQLDIPGYLKKVLGKKESQTNKKGTEACRKETVQEHENTRKGKKLSLIH